MNLVRFWARLIATPAHAAEQCDVDLNPAYHRMLSHGAKHSRRSGAGKSICKVPIYHYTSAGGLLGIAAKHCLWATEAFGLNDVAELRHGWDFVKGWLEDQSEDEVVEEMMSHVQDPDAANPDVEVFMCCASTLSDDASQWRLYADAAHGYVIELDPSVELAVLSRPAAFPDGEEPVEYGINDLGRMLLDWAQVSPWMRVMYTDGDKATALASFRASLRDLFDEYDRQIRSADSWDEADLLRQERNGEVRAGLAILAHCMKAEAFKSESEVRAVATLFYNVHCELRPTSYGIVRYVGLVASPAGVTTSRVVAVEPSLLPINSVRLGAAQVARNSRRAATVTLQRWEYDHVVVLESTARLR